ncbi:T9SS type A sorting domain-containing protein [Dyadobacter sp. NIV53]|uniref:T9SS type A sorting domain-containing protein n=1 Tax=Dyadobacter sp. NIV53 TaxID=2861765 RepID=UPI001C8896E0|nr:T9SS type A sorting domain-containing protein [Dyadobacter sp. NIV53]
MKKPVLVQFLYFVYRTSFLFGAVILCSGSQLLFAQSGSLPFRDDFSRNSLGGNWKDDKTWSILNGRAYNPYDAGSLVTAKKYAADSYILETAAMGFTGSYWRQFRITFGQADVSSSQSYVLSYSPDTGGQLTLGRSSENIYYPAVLDEISIYPALTDTKWYKFKIARYKSGLIQVYLNQGSGYGSVPVLEAIDLSYQRLGHFGWMVSTQTAAKKFYIDWIEVRIPENEKPAILEKPKEDDLIAQVSAASNKSYRVAKLASGSSMYTDRDYKVTSVPSYLKDASFIQTPMDDKYQTGTSWLTTFLKKASVVYIAYDPRAIALPAWLQDWHKTGDVIGTNDPGSRLLEIYSKSVDYWQIYPRPFILGANLASPATGAQMNYLVIAVQKPANKNLEAEDAKVVGAKISHDRAGYSGSGFVDFVHEKQDYIEWTTETKVPGVYTLSFQFANGSNSNRSMRLMVDDEAVESPTFMALSSWDSWAFYSGAQVILEPGTHKIRMTANGMSGPNIDFLSLSFRSVSPESVSETLAARTAFFNNEMTNPLSNFRPLAYPNPFQRSTTISYVLPETTNVNLTIYTLLGQKQAVLLDQPQKAGKYDIEFDAGNLQSGLYFYQLTQGNKISVGKIFKQ